MNTKLKQTGVMGITAILLLASVATIPSFIGEAEAEYVRVYNAVPPEAEPDVDLSVKQMFEPRKIPEVRVIDLSGHTSASSDPDVGTYKVLYKIQNEGTTDVRHIMISVHSDTETVEGELSVWLDEPRHSTIGVTIKAVDPTSINAEIIGYQLE